MIEFKQVIGRGTRLYEGKAYFTIYDFVKAHAHFSDPEWDGDPVEEEIGPMRPMGPIRPMPPAPPSDALPPRTKAKVRLADGKEPRSST